MNAMALKVFKVFMVLVLVLMLATSSCFLVLASDAVYESVISYAVFCLKKKKKLIQKS